MAVVTGRSNYSPVPGRSCAEETVSDEARERDPVVQRTALRLWRVEDNRSFFTPSDLFFRGDVPVTQIEAESGFIWTDSLSRTTAMRLLSPTHFLVTLVATAALLGGADGCSSDPNIEGAKLYIRSEDYTSALANLETALAENPDNAEALALKGRVLQLQAKNISDPMERHPFVEQMMAALNRAEALAPGDDDVAFTRLSAWAEEMTSGGRLLQNSGGDEENLTKAIQAFENATYIQPDSSSGHYNLGLAHLVDGNADNAIAPFETAIATGGGDANAYLYCGRALLATGSNASRALEMLEEGSGLYPDDEPLRAELLNAYAATGQTDRALTAYEDAITRDPDNPVLRYNYGSTLLKAERFDDAIVQLERAIAIEPDNANSQYNMGAAYQNKATAVNVQLIAAGDDDAEARRLRIERDGLLEQALPYLVEARSLTEAQGESPADICTALFQVYAQLSRSDEATEAGECSEQDMN